MRNLILATAGLLLAVAAPATAQTRIDSINTNFRWLGPDDKIVVDRYDDPKVDNVSCYLSRAQTGGVKEALAWPKIPAVSRLLVGPSAVSRYLLVSPSRR